MNRVLPRLRAGDMVEVKGRDEILATLDKRGCLDGMPFMPEMLQYCGRRLRVANVAHKACDSKCKTGLRSVPHSVHLEDIRCDGMAHDGCQARCNIFWKTAWLRKVGSPPPTDGNDLPGRCSDADLARATHADGADGRRYTCQATQILEASQPLPWWKPGHYVQDLTSGNVSVGRLLRVLVLSWFEIWRRYSYPYRLSRWSYAKVHRLLTGREDPFRPDMEHPAKTPTGRTDLEVGERVRVKPHLEIQATLNKAGRNRGLWFDPEMVPYCGKEFRVAQRVDKIIDEVTGEMLHMKGPCIMLDGVACRGDYTQNRRLCPKAMIIYWREIWLDRVNDAEAAGTHRAKDASAS